MYSVVTSLGSDWIFPAETDRRVERSMLSTRVDLVGTYFVHVVRAGYEDICAIASFCLVWNIVQIRLGLYNIGE